MCARLGQRTEAVMVRPADRPGEEHLTFLVTHAQERFRLNPENMITSTLCGKRVRWIGRRFRWSWRRGPAGQASCKTCRWIAFESGASFFGG